MNSAGSVVTVRRVLAAIGAAVLGVVVLAAPAAARVSVQPAAAGVLTVSAGRLGATTAAVLGLIGVVTGGMALGRPSGRLGPGSGRLGVVVPLAAGPTAMALGALVVATSDGGLGTGNGLGGALVALLVGLVATILGGTALARARRAG
ncbi:DUF6223 family protein [Streptomyces sp. NPDC088124]|uniref:DUF6223 family protein n=1 Tax=Streptomyces sp. NPDC088124 TaxID=3154654 RepID=UPI0034394B78